MDPTESINYSLRNFDINITFNGIAHELTSSCYQSKDNQNDDRHFVVTSEHFTVNINLVELKPAQHRMK